MQANLALPAAAPATSTRRRSSTATRAQTPLLDAVLERGDRCQEVPFHVPGHKKGSGTPPRLAPLLNGSERYDLTELEGGLTIVLLQA